MGRLALRRARDLLYLREQHVWYECDLDGGRPRRELVEGARLVHPGPMELEHVARLGQDAEQARERREGGNDIWLIVEGDEPLFACCTFRRTAPVMAAPRGTLKLPEGVACLEDSVTAEAARGRGIAPAAWTLIGDELQGAGYRTLITKVATDNAASRRAVEKVGFKEVAVMDHHRIGALRRTFVRPVGDGLGEELAARLT